MADKLNFSLVSPERELFSGQVDQVDLPGMEGDLGVFPDHSPLMTAIRAGLITIYGGEGEQQFFVQGGFADVTPEGLSVLAERAVLLSDLNRDDLTAHISAAETQLETLDGEPAVFLRRDIDGLRAVAQQLG